MILIGAFLIVQLSPMGNPRPNLEVRSNLELLLVACKDYWENTDSQNSCTVETASKHGYIRSPELTVEVSGNESSLIATALGERSGGTWVMDARGKIRLLKR